MKTNQVWILTIESLEGIKDVKTYATKEEAIKALKEVTKGIKTTDCTEGYGKCEAALVDKDLTVYLVQRTKDAVSLINKVAWTINQRIYFETKDSDLEWTKMFATKEKAVSLYKWIVNGLETQAMNNPEIEFRYEEDGLGVQVYKNDKLVTKVYCDSAPIDQDVCVRVPNLNVI